jgi:hypothetical protein
MVECGEEAFMKLIKYLFVATVLLIAGCSKGMDATVDASSMENYKKSIAAIKTQLTPEENKQLNEALQVLLMPEADNEAGLFGALAQLANTESLEKNFLATIDRKTPREIIAMGDQKVRDRQEKELASINSEIQELEKKETEYNSSKTILSKIIVKDSKYYHSETGFMSTPVIELKVTNDTGIAISRIFFHGVVSTPGRAIPWISEDFNYTLPGGIENGETRHLKLAPNMFSGWGNSKTKKRKDTVFTVEVVNARNAEGKDLATVFNKDDEERLSYLKKAKKELEEKLRK